MAAFLGDYFCWLQNVGRETIIFQVAKKSYAVIQGLQERVCLEKIRVFFSKALHLFLWKL